MPLITLPDGSHSYIPDQQQNILPDLDALNAPRGNRGQVRPLALNDFYDAPVDPVNLPGIFYFRAALREGRGGIVQDAFFNDPEASGMASGDMVFDRDGIARPAFKTNSDPTNQPSNSYGDRLVGANFLGVDLITCAEIPGGTEHLFKDNGTGTRPSIVPVAGFAAPAGASLKLCMEGGQVNGAPALFIGWSVAAANTLQVLTDLNNPPTSSLVGIGAFPCWGVCQVGIDGNSVQAYTQDASGGLIKMFNTNVATGAATIVSRTRLTGGGYTVGLANIGYNPQVYYVVPRAGYTMLGATYLPIGPGYYHPSFKGSLVSVDLRAFEVHDVHTALDFVLYATKSKYGIFYCNGRQHQYLTQGSDFPVDAGVMWASGAGFSRICRGHWCVDDRVFWCMNVTSSGGLTYKITFEFDTVTYKIRQVSKTMSLLQPSIAGADLFSMGGPRLPHSEATQNLIDNVPSAGGWVYQYQNRSSEVGWIQRHVDGEPTLSGVEFEQTCTWVTPRMTPKGHPRARFVWRKVTGPSMRNLRAGGTDAGSYMTIQGNDQPLVQFDATESTTLLDRRPVRHLPNNNSWSYGFQAEITGHQGTQGHDGGLDATRYAGNYADVVIEGYYYDEAMTPPPALAVMSSWDRQA